MWAVALHSERSYQELLKTLGSQTEYKLVTTATGGNVAEAPRGTKYPHLFLVGDNLQQTKHVLSWLHTNLHPSVIVSSDLCPDCEAGESGNATHGNRGAYFVPPTCLRSAGRSDLGGAPVLFEELHFDSELRTKILTSLHESHVDSTHLLFGSTKNRHRPEECGWLFQHLNCRSWDSHTAELLLASQRLGAKVACLKVFERNDENEALGLLIAGWRRIVELL
jgi:hypothetical protein